MIYTSVLPLKWYMRDVSSSFVLAKGEMDYQQDSILFFNKCEEKKWFDNQYMQYISYITWDLLHNLQKIGVTFHYVTSFQEYNEVIEMF